MESKVIFEGPGPFHLPVAQEATATGNSNNGVTLKVYCLVLERESGVQQRKEAEPIGIQMASHVAEALAHRLLDAVKESRAP